MLGEETTYEIIKTSPLSVKLLHRPPCSDTISHVGSGRVRQQHWSGGTPKSTNYFPACFTALSSLLDLETLQTTCVCEWDSKWENKSERDGRGALKAGNEIHPSRLPREQQEAVQGKTRSLNHARCTKHNFLCLGNFFWIIQHVLLSAQLNVKIWIWKSIPSVWVSTQTELVVFVVFFHFTTTFRVQQN